MIVEAATTDDPKLRWEPGESAPAIREIRPTMTDEEWRMVVMDDLGLADWLDPTAA